jgi:hypothetical protein
MDVAPAELDWFWGFETTNMPRRWRCYGPAIGLAEIFVATRFPYP